MGVIEKRRWTVEEYLDWEERQEERHELVDGRPVLMVGAMVGHDLICINIVSALQAALKGRRCRAHSGGAKVRTGRDNVRYPDASIDCGPLDLKGRLTAEPTVVFEVLSPSTWAVDLNEKLADYRATPSIRHYVTVAQDRVQVTVWNRVDGTLVRGVEFTALSDVVDLPAVDVRLPLAAIYDEVTFDEVGDEVGNGPGDDAG